MHPFNEILKHWKEQQVAGQTETQVMPSALSANTPIALQPYLCSKVVSRHEAELLSVKHCGQLDETTKHAQPEVLFHACADLGINWLTRRLLHHSK